ncbi:hypothetical protein [Klebsiella phage Kpn17]|uniref:Uncharacterized protein n=1 Tax=Klebsiella phage Kpn17 TaxID=3044025 RepID=A0AAT9V6D6_9CAUD|nr:hypothetical protein [Klebsiella phage Kpn17]
MLKPIEHILNNPNDLPDVPRAVKEYLQSRFMLTSCISQRSVSYVRLATVRSSSPAYYMVTTWLLVSLTRWRAVSVHSKKEIDYVFLT